MWGWCGGRGRAGFLRAVGGIGAEAGGGPVNINADDAAGALARVRGARAVGFLTDVPGVLDRSGTLIDSLTPGRAEELIADGTIAGGMIAKVRAAARAADPSGERAVLASWGSPDVLEALAQGRTPGTAILSPASSGRPLEKELQR